MTSSGVTAWSMTVLDLIRTAMVELAIPGVGTDVDDDELVDCTIRLNGMLKSWQLKGVSLGREQSVDITTTAATATKTLAAGVRTISSARLITSATQERRLWEMGRDDYNALPNKAAVGTPSSYYLSRQRDAAILHLWPVSATTVTIRLDYDKITETVTLGTETVDIREELQETVYANLAVRIAGIFGATITPELAARAQSLETQMFDAERPDSCSFEYGYA